VPPGERGAALGKGQLDLAEIDTSAARRITVAHSKRAGKKKGEQRGDAPAGGPLGPAGAQGAPMHPEVSSMRAWAEGHMSKTALKKAEKEDKSRQQAVSKAARQARAKQQAWVAENRQLRGYTVRKALGTAYTQLAMNGESGPLQDERVRRAVARAIDRPKLAKQALGKLGLPAKPLGSHLMMPDQAGYSDQSAALGGADVQAAQQLLADSGWRGQGSSGQGADAKPQHGPAEGKQNGKAESAGRNAADTSGSSDKGADGKDGGKDGKHAEAGEAGGGHKSAGVPVRMKGGQPLALRFVLPSGPGSEQARATGARISRTLAGLGIATKVKKVSGESYFKDHIASGDYDLALFSWPASAYPATDGRPIFAKPQPAPDGSLQVEQNYTRVGTDQIDQLFDRASGELDDESRDEFIQRADARIWATAGSVPLYQKPELAAAKDRLVNAGAFGFRTPRYQDIGYQKD
jgi:peptide/nickel transport system substrate-binding protein